MFDHVHLNPFQLHCSEGQQQLKQLKEKYGVLAVEYEDFQQTTRKTNHSNKVKNIQKTEVWSVHKL